MLTKNARVTDNSVWNELKGGGGDGVGWGVCMCVCERGINLKFCILSSVSHTQLVCQHHGVHLPAHLPDCSLESPGYTQGPAHGCEHEAEFKKQTVAP